MEHLYINRNASRTVVVLHGMGGTKEDMVELSELLAPDHNALLIDGDEFSSGMRRYFKRLPNGFDYTDMAQRANALAETIAVAAKQYGFNPELVDAFGFSNGANMLLGMVLMQAYPFAKVLALRPALLELNSQSEASKTRVRIQAGQQDPYLSLANLPLLVAKFSSAMIEHQIYPGGHTVTEGDIRDGRQFLAA